MAFRWRAGDGPLIVVLGPSLPSSTKTKKVIKVGPPLAKLSGSVHANRHACGSSTTESNVPGGLMQLWLLPAVLAKFKDTGAVTGLLVW